jgi:hypothetical protein
VKVMVSLELLDPRSQEDEEKKQEDAMLVAQE